MEKQPTMTDQPRSLADELRAAFDQGSLPARRAGSEARAKVLADRIKLLRERTDVAHVDSASASRQMLAFHRGTRKYGILLEHVREVQMLEQFSWIPGAPAGILGVVHWRGMILALLDLSSLFGLPETGLSDLHVFIVVESAGQRLAIAASQADDVLAMAADRLRDAPDLPPRILPEWVIGVHGENRLVLRMDAIMNGLRAVPEP
jgi:purine-binding chemotaxis protein CheW